MLYELPRVLQSSEAGADAPHREYPSAVFVDARTLLVADGTGLLYVLHLQAGSAAELVNVYGLEIPDEEKYHSAVRSVPSGRGDPATAPEACS